MSWNVIKNFPIDFDDSLIILSRTYLREVDVKNIEKLRF